VLVFVLIWLALLGYMYLQNRKSLAEAPGLQKYGDALLVALEEVPDAAQARTFMAATERWTAIRRTQSEIVAGVVLHELRDAAGQVVYATDGWQWDASVPSARDATSLQDGYWRYDKTGAHWRLRILNPRRTTAAFLRYNARIILPYLLLAFPMVLIAVWLTVRNNLRPLNQLAQRIGERASDDLRPVGIEAHYRELKPLVQALDTLLQRLRGTVQRERALVQDAAHELRTPLAVIGAQAHVLARSDEPAARMQAQHHLDQAIARAAHLSHQLLALAALDDDARRSTQVVDLAHWLRDALARATPTVSARAMELALEGPDMLARQIDLPALDSVLQNLVENAVRHGRAGGQVLVRLAALPGHPQGWQLSVQDDGPGLPEADRAHVVERFFRGTATQAAGTGLGLAIVRQAAQRLHGQASLIGGLNGGGFGVLVETRGPPPAVDRP